MTLDATEAGHRGAPTVVLLHGAGLGRWMWRRQIAALADDLHLLAPDLPGHGESSGRPWTSVAATAAAVAELVAARATDGRAQVVGLSLGGYVGLHLAATAGWIDGLTVSGTSVLPFPYRRMITALTAAMAPLGATSALLRANARALRIPADDFEDYCRSARATSSRTVRRATAAAISFSLPEGAANSPCPVLAVAGEREHDRVRRSVSEIATGFPHGTGRLAAGAGHVWNLERPELFSAMIRARVLGGPLPEPLRPT